MFCCLWSSPGSCWAPGAPWRWKFSPVCSWVCSTAALGWCELGKMKEKGMGGCKAALSLWQGEDGSWGRFSAAWKTAFPLEQAKQTFH